MNILIIGAGGREHALAWKISQSQKCEELFCAPGNAGIGRIARLVDLNIANHTRVIEFCRDKNIGLVVVGPEAPLVDGLVDALDEAGITAFGPSAAAARLEGSKGFTKDLCARYDIPTAAYKCFDNKKAALSYVKKTATPLVIKADGLAAGKGVIIAMKEDEALAAVSACFDGTYGDAGAQIVIEEFLEGEEASLFAVCDGQTAMLLGTAQDHKRVCDGDTGPNTGGMGAYSPAPILTQALIDEIMETIIVPTLAGMHAMGAPFKGILYAGLMLTDDGPKLIEYNTRFGDPECQVVLTRLKSDLVEIMLAAATGSLLEVEAEWKDEAALTVVMAARGYPGAYEKGTPIEGTDRAEACGAIVFHAGTAFDDNRLVANGGRVLNITGFGKTITQAQQIAYRGVKQIDWDDGFYREDIGWRAVAREKQG